MNNKPSETKRGARKRGQYKFKTLQWDIRVP